MYDETSDEIGVFDFDEFASHLVDQGVDASPSLLHGCLSGLLAGGADAQPEYGLDAMSRSLEVHVHGELAARIMQLYTVTLEALQGDEFLFSPLLPDDEDDIVLRTESLASWCRGFLTGFAFCVAAQKAVGAALSKETGEVLTDITAMTEAVADEGDDEDEAEGNYTELVEYLRVAVANVFLDGLASRAEGLAAAPDRSLH